MNRKKRVKGGDQHRICVAIDNELWDTYVASIHNRNRLINDCLYFCRDTQHAAQHTLKYLNGNAYEKINKEIWE